MTVKKVSLESPACLNFRGLTRKGWQVQFTLRDEDETSLLERFGKFIQRLESLEITPCGQAEAKHIGDRESQKTASNGSSYEEMQGGKLVVVTSEKGEKRYKYKGGHYTKFGLPVYPEIMEQLGWNLAKLEIGKEYDLGQRRVKVLTEDGKAVKVIGFSGK